MHINCILIKKIKKIYLSFSDTKNGELLNKDHYMIGEHQQLIIREKGDVMSVVN